MEGQATLAGKARRRRPERAPPPPTPPSVGDQPAASDAQRAYFARLRSETMVAYAVAEQARARGLDPSVAVEIPPAEDLAARVEAQVGPPGVAARVREATKRIGDREQVSLFVAREVARDLLASGAPKEKCLDNAVRTGLSILTEGVLVAPLEGIAKVQIGQNADGTDYVDLWFAGPIRAAGGTGQAMSVLIADVVRRDLGIGTFVATNSEVERYKEEIPAYKQSANLQYTPTSSEIERIARNCPVCINGEGTEAVEVTGNRDLPRVEGNRLRGGACLVMAEGLALKAPKILKHVDKLELPGWSFLEGFAKKDDDEGPTEGLPPIHPVDKFVRDIIAGRPVFSHPSRPGGFRLRYGRARTAGLASTAVHPATMALLDDFLAVGTQIKVERPGKGTLATPCDTIDGPAVVLRGGGLHRLETMEDVRNVRGRVDSIVDLGEMLIPYGEFAENNAHLPRSSWVHEWWDALRVEKGAPPIDFDGPSAKDGPAASAVQAPGEGQSTDPTRRESPRGAAMVEHAEATGIPLHPDGTLLWHDLAPEAFKAFAEALAGGRWDGRLHVPDDATMRATLELLLCPHRVEGGQIHVDERNAYPLLRCVGLDAVGSKVVKTPRSRVLMDPCQPDLDALYPSVDLASRLAGIPIMPRAPCRVGGRMGRPEKADARKMKPPPHGLFPIGQAGGNQRLIGDAALAGTIEVEIGDRKCERCGKDAWRMRCEACGERTAAVVMDGAERPRRMLDLRAELERAKAAVGLRRIPPVKGVKGVINADKTAEPLEKGLLRAIHNIWVFKDGTTRYDLTDIPLTHFRPREIGTPVATLVSLGYTHDIRGAPLTDDEQMLELRCQDIIVNNHCLKYLQSTAHFIDDLLERFYGLPPFYGADRPEDMIGCLAIGLAPHTSSGVLCRIIGQTTAQGHFAHPFFHAAKRRNCDGDEDAVLLLLDGLLNFSRAFVPDRRGGLMDLPLVLTTRLDPSEIDKEAHNVDTLFSYPLAFYEATTRHAHAKEVADLMGLLGEKIGTAAQYEGFGFTHDTTDISAGPAISAYKTIDNTRDKLTAQMELARRIRAVDEPDVGAKVIGTHLLPDIMGNLKAFSRQKIRCPLCNSMYRRMPLKACCLRCGNPKLTLTVHEKSVRKYLEVSKEIGAKYKIDAYTLQRIHLLEGAVDSLFHNDKVRKAKLDDFF